MTQEDYDAWADCHAATFGLASELVARMLDAWKAVFEIAGYGVDELYDATRHIAAYSPPRFLSDHLPAIRARVTERRLQQARENLLASEITEECDLCQDTGWVSVPLLRSVIDGQWTCLSCSLPPAGVVTCKCLRGSRLYNVWRGGGERNKFNPLALADYERQVPHWFELLRQRRKLADATAKADRVAKEMQQQTVGQLKLFVANATRS